MCSSIFCLISLSLSTMVFDCLLLLSLSTDPLFLMEVPVIPSVMVRVFKNQVLQTKYLYSFYSWMISCGVLPSCIIFDFTMSLLCPYVSKNSLSVFPQIIISVEYHDESRPIFLHFSKLDSILIFFGGTIWFFYLFIYF